MKEKLVLKVVEWSMNYGISINNARRLTEDEKATYADDWKDRILIGVGENIELNNLNSTDLFEVVSNDDDYAGAFLGSHSQCYYLTSENEEKLLKLNEEKGKAKQEKEEREEKENLIDLVKRVEEKRVRVMPRKDIKGYLVYYNNLYNEGGEGYVPEIIATEDYEESKKILGNLKA